MNVRSGTTLRVAAVMSSLLLVSACGGDTDDVDPIDPDGAAEPVEDEATEDEATEDEPVDDGDAGEGDEEPSALGVDEIPDDAGAIDEDYVQRVLEALDPLYGDAFAAFAAADEVDEQVMQTALLVFSANEAAERSSLYVDESPDLVDGSGPPDTRLLSVVSASPACISATVERDVSGVFMSPGDPRLWEVVLIPSTTTEASGVAWAYDEQFVLRDEDEPGFDGCDGRGES